MTSAPPKFLEPLARDHGFRVIPGRLDGDVKVEELGRFLTERADVLLLAGEEVVETPLGQQGELVHHVTHQADLREWLEQPQREDHAEGVGEHQQEQAIGFQFSAEPARTEAGVALMLRMSVISQTVTPVSATS